jgi:hypothetical protein
MSTITLKPGLLVSLRTRMEGGVQYERRDLAVSAEEKLDEASAVQKWQTTKTVADPAALERATKARGKCGSLIRGVCAYSEFGLICTVDKEGQLDVAITESRELADRFNAENLGIRISVYALKGRIAQNDQEAARAIGGELRELLDTMQAGVTEIDVEKIREAASRAKKLGATLDADTNKKVQSAIDEVRDVARQIVKKAVEKGADVGAYVKTVTLTSLGEARSAFLDLEGEVEIAGEGLAPVAARDVEMDEVEQAAASSVEA